MDTLEVLLRKKSTPVVSGKVAERVESGGVVGPTSTHMEPSVHLARHTGMDHYDREAARELGLDPDNPAVIASFDFVRWDLGMFLDWTDPSSRGQCDT